MSRLAAFVLLVSSLVFAGENLKINPHLDYATDSNDGPLILGDHLDAGFTRGKPAYVFMYGQG